MLAWKILIKVRNVPLKGKIYIKIRECHQTLKFCGEIDSKQSRLKCMVAF